MDDKKKLEILIEEYVKKIELIRNNHGGDITNEFKDEIFEDYALATGSIKYAKLSGIINEEEANALKDKISVVTNNVKETDYIF